MPSPVYSTKLFAAPSFSGAAVVVFTVPNGFICVVRTLTIVWGDVTVSGLDAWVQDDTLTKLTRVSYPTAYPLAPVYGGRELWDGRHVLDQGQTLAVQTAAGTADFRGSGYLLSLP